MLGRHNYIYTESVQNKYAHKELISLQCSSNCVLLLTLTNNKGHLITMLITDIMSVIYVAYFNIVAFVRKKLCHFFSLCYKFKGVSSSPFDLDVELRSL